MNPILEEDEEDRDDQVVRPNLTSDSLSHDRSQSDRHEGVGDLYVPDKSEGMLEVFPVLVRKLTNHAVELKEEESDPEEGSEIQDQYHPEIMAQVVHRLDLSALDRIFLAIFETRKPATYNDASQSKSQETALLELALNTLNALKEEDDRLPS